jgi:hypothetical protein
MTDSLLENPTAKLGILPSLGTSPEMGLTTALGQKKDCDFTDLRCLALWLTGQPIVYSL